jgi:hypothetical protein
MHQATPVAVVLIDLSHFLFALAGETRLGVPNTSRPLALA